MMLVDEGKIALDDPVEKYLPEFHNQMLVAEKDQRLTVLKKPTHPITVRNILSHTSGLVGKSPLERELDTLSLREGAISYALSPLQFDPDTKYDYCNPGINTVGRLVEVVSGRPYEVFMQNRLFDPLGMKDTTFWPTEEQVKRLAKSYKPRRRASRRFRSPSSRTLSPTRSATPIPPAGSFQPRLTSERFAG